MKALQFPLVRVTLFFVCGIIAGNILKPTLYTALLITLLTFIMSVVTLVYCRRQFNQKMPFGILIYCFSFVVGMLAYTVNNGYVQNNHYIHQLTGQEEGHVLQIVVKEKLKSNFYKDRYVAEVTSLDRMPSCGLILVNLDKAGLAENNIAIGTEILTHGKISKHRPPLNPDQFDYGKYLSNKAIAAQVYVSPDDLKITDTIKSLTYYAAAFRDRVIGNLSKSQFEKEELAVITALILGQQQDISKETIQDYQYAGAIHILSVSGLHVGYIMLFVNFILLRLPKDKKGNLVRVIIILSALWFFSLIAGLSPSIVRSATMFSVVAIGMYLKRETYIFHTLIASMLLILMISPAFLFDVGFQLSYVSLFFILWLQPYFSRLWKPRFKITKYFWDIVTISAAAQIGALPLSIYYFHQFPGLFFITNIIILPALGIIMGFGVLVMALAFFGTIPAYLVKSLEFLIWLLNQTISRIASFEQFIIKDIPLNSGMMLALYLFLFALFAWLMKPIYRNLIWTLIFLIFLQGNFTYNRWRIGRTNEMIVFRSKNTSLITERNGHDLNVLCDDSLRGHTDKNQTLTAYRIANFSAIRKTSTLGNLVYYNGKKIYAMDSTGIYPKNIKPDILLMSQSPKVNLERALEELNPDLVIADASNLRTYTQLWKATCRKQKIPFHAIAEKGFYKME